MVTLRVIAEHRFGNVYLPYKWKKEQRQLISLAYNSMVWLYGENQVVSIDLFSIFFMPFSYNGV